MTEITVAIPTHNRRGTVLPAVMSALGQTRPPERAVVIADGCTDGTEEALAALGDHRVEVLSLPKGPGYGYGHRNLALERAGTGVVAWLGDDDLWMPDHLQRVAALFDADEADIVQTLACVVDEESNLEPLGMDWRVPVFRRQFLKGHNRTPMGAVAHRAADALAVGGWRTEVERRGDRDLWQRILRAGGRSTMIGTPTLLHFRGTGRRQTPEQREAQNEAYLARLQDPYELARLRSAMDLAVQRQWAETMSRARVMWWWIRTLFA